LYRFLATCTDIGAACGREGMASPKARKPRHHCRGFRRFGRLPSSEPAGPVAEPVVLPGVDPRAAPGISRTPSRPHSTHGAEARVRICREAAIRLVVRPSEPLRRHLPLPHPPVIVAVAAADGTKVAVIRSAVAPPVARSVGAAPRPAPAPGAFWSITHPDLRGFAALASTRCGRPHGKETCNERSIPPDTADLQPAAGQYFIER
jgi:hypothetical protein